jgi:hypothetical protein
MLEELFENEPIDIQSLMKILHVYKAGTKMTYYLIRNNEVLLPTIKMPSLK